MYRFTFISFYLIALVFVCESLNAQTFDWVQTIRPGGNEHCWDITTDFKGNLLTTGRVKSNSTFGSGVFIQSPPYKSCCETDVFIAKYRPNGDLVWVNRDGGKQPDWGRAITSDKDGNVFVTGEYSDTAFFGTYQTIAVGTYQNRNIFLAKYDSSGTCLWLKAAGNAAGHSRGYGVTTDSLGNSYLTGHITGISNFDGISFGVAGKNIPFVAKFSAQGNCVWVKNIAVQYSGEGDNIKIGKDGNIVVVGNYCGTLTVNSVNYPGNSPSWGDVFVIKMDTSGNFIWATTAIGAFQDQANAIDFDSNENIYIAGTFANDLTFGSTIINSLGASTNAGTANARADGFIAKYTKNGNFMWVKTIRNSANGLVDDLFLSTINITKSNKILVGGSFVGNVDLDGVLLTLDTLHETGYLAAFDTSGNLLWYKIAGGINNTYFNVRGVTSDNYNNYYVGGGFTGNPNIVFDSITVQSLNGYDGLIAKITPPLTPIVSALDTIVCPGQSVNYSVVQDGSPISYQWSFPGGVPTTATSINPVINYSVQGNYISTLIIANGHQTDTTQINIWVTPGACVSAPEYENQFNILISPNPVSSTAIIHLDGFDFSENITLQLYNYLGEEIGAPLIMKEREYVLDVATISSGGYFLKIIQNHSVIKTEKLLILNH